MWATFIFGDFCWFCCCCWYSYTEFNRIHLPRSESIDSTRFSWLVIMKNHRHRHIPSSPSMTRSSSTKFKHTRLHHYFTWPNKSDTCKTIYRPIKILTDRFQRRKATFCVRLRSIPSIRSLPLSLLSCLHLIFLLGDWTDCIPNPIRSHKYFTLSKSFNS